MWSWAVRGILAALAAFLVVATVPRSSLTPTQSVTPSPVAVQGPNAGDGLRGERRRRDGSRRGKPRRRDHDPERGSGASRWRNERRSDQRRGARPRQRQLRKRSGDVEARTPERKGHVP